MVYKILGISGSPVKQGNVETLLNRALDGLPGREIEREAVHLRS
jgi:multimeric flavodoxin WrbA